MLTGDAKTYFETLLRGRRDVLLKQRAIERQEIGDSQNFQAALNRVGYLGIFQPDCDFITGSAQAHAEAVLKAYEMQGEQLTQEIIDNEIMPEVQQILASCSAVVSREKNRIERLEQTTRRLNSSKLAMVGSLKRHLENVMHDAREAICNGLTLKMLEARKIGFKAKRGAVLPPGEYAFHPEIQEVSQQLFLEGNHRQAVLDAFIHLIWAVRERTGLPYDGDDLMNRAFSPKNGKPPVRFNALNTPEEHDEQVGIWFLFKGVVRMRNYKAHKVTPFDNPERAHEYLALASLLMRLLDMAEIG